MLRRTLRPALAVLAGLTLLAAAAGAASANSCPDPQAGPPYDFTTELVGQFGTPIPLKNMGLLTRSTHGFLYRTGQQDNHVTITEAGNRLRIVDTGTAKWKAAPPTGCWRQKAAQGIAAVCTVPGGVSESQPLLVEVWPRLGNDYVDGHTLPATVSLSVLADAGNDVARLGAGRDFFNGHSGHDVVWGGGGNDWIRSGRDNDTVHAGAGNDYVVGQQGADTLAGNAGDDRLYGSDGRDTLYPGGGTDFVSCGSGFDRTTVDALDRVSRTCEAVRTP